MNVFNNNKLYQKFRRNNYNPKFKRNNKNSKKSRLSLPKNKFKKGELN